MYDSTKDQSKTTVDDQADNHFIETVVEGVEGIDQPMEDDHPNVPAVLALGAYPIVLAVAIVGGLLFFFLFR